MAPAVTSTSVPTTLLEAYEATHVHAIYDRIALHFSSTRYKPWPIIASFLEGLEDGWVGLDSGTGNGKYLPLPLDRPGRLWTIGLDRSRNLLQIAQLAGGTEREVVWGDVLGSAWRHEIFDYAISIATIHHLATPDRRKLAVEKLLSAVSPNHGRVLVYVWAVRQDEQSKRDIPTDPASSGSGQDVFVPWVMSDKTQVFNRYYHMFEDGELASLVVLAAEGLGLVVGSPSETAGLKGVEIRQNGWERSNHYVELRRWQT
ncbi:S-adenosyl-L-methionine-dependent methyltransferase [Mycena belliarum]|uniref:S-adenosyl-L-methionine-dependent methyltransferase n=1 Tax=Mycena belliarum TaxID=1033014 RepID=A0AAD6UIG8_9AGAR|nr:S-adenosyl-L-methionine-dependent methyltransferase [Mycena belliae]